MTNREMPPLPQPPAQAGEMPSLNPPDNSAEVTSQPEALPMNPKPMPILEQTMHKNPHVPQARPGAPAVGKETVPTAARPAGFVNQPAFPGEVHPTMPGTNAPVVKKKSAAECVAPIEPRRPMPELPGQIEVKALRDGFYQRERRPEGTKFRVNTYEELGTWMLPTDPVLAQKWRAEQAAKKRARYGARKQTDYDSGH